MTLLLRHLRRINIVPAPPLAVTGSDADLICMDYEGFLLREHSVMPSSAGKYLDVARRFLSERFPTGKIYLKKLQAGDIIDFLLYDTSRPPRPDLAAGRVADWLAGLGVDRFPLPGCGLGILLD